MIVESTTEYEEQKY